jgi:CRP-like cAMP-binding protein
LYGEKRTASIIATSDCVCWELDGTVFKNIIVNTVIKRRNIEVGYLDKVDLFAKVDKYDKLKLIDGLETVFFEKDLNIITEGDDGDYFYIIEEGDVECYKKDDKTETSVRMLKSGDHFGEIALI